MPTCTLVASPNSNACAQLCQAMLAKMMVSSFLWASAFCIYAVSAFQDTSPFFLFSTSTYASQIRDLYSGTGQANVAFRHFQSQSPQIVKAATLSRNLERQLGHCPSDAYVLVSQAGVSTADYSSKGSMSQMRAKMLGKEGRIGSSMSVQDVLGNLDIEAFSRMLQDKCGAALTRIDASSECISESRIRLTPSTLSDSMHSGSLRHRR